MRGTCVRVVRADAHVGGSPLPEEVMDGAAVCEEAPVLMVS